MFTADPLISTNLIQLRTISATVSSRKGREIAQTLMKVVTSYNQREKRRGSPKRARGLAAIQIRIPLRVVVVLFDVDDDRSFLSLANPGILDSSPQDEQSVEGCLSLPGQEFVIPRCREIRVIADGLRKQGEWFGPLGDMPVVIQHEIDHTVGWLICDVGRPVQVEAAAIG